MMGLGREMIAAVGVLCALSATACVSSVEGAQMRTEMDTLKAQQDAMQQGLDAREAKIAEMIALTRKENEALRQTIASAQETLQKVNAERGVDLQQMREELNQLRGSAEELDFRLAKMEQDMRLFKEDVELRLEGSASSTKLPADATELFNLGFQQLAGKQYRDARKACETFLARHSGDTRVPDAIYCVGETYFMEAQYISSIYEYQKIVKSHDKSKRMPDAALRIGQAFKKLGRCEQSTPFFELVAEEYKRTEAGKTAQAELKAGCK